MENPVDSPQIVAAMRAALEAARRAPETRYAEVRLVDEASETLRVRDGRPEEVKRASSRGIAVRVLGARTWGFACTPETTEAAAVRAVAQAVAIARASGSLAPTPVPFPEMKGAVGSYRTPVAIDPFSIALAEKLATLEAPVKALLAKGTPIRSAEAWMSWTRTNKRLMTTEGTDVTQSFTYGAHGMQVIAVGADGNAQRRSFPTWQGGDGFQAGYERVKEIDLLARVDQVAREAIELLAAPPCPAGVRDVILESSQVGLQIHESCGHPTELDRALGTEISLAGGSFMQPSMLDRLRYGSQHVTLVADSTKPGGMGTFGWDDEGIAAGTHALVREGMFVDYLSSRETAAALGRASTGTMRGDGWSRPPLIRMVNVSLDAGRGTLDELIADTKDGVYIETDKSWSIDDLRLNFQFSCELAWEIKNGKKTRLLRDPFYTGVTPQFWGSCDAVCGPSEWKLWGINTCGKGDPMQMMQVGHGAAPARFRNVSVGNAGGQS